jgi:hypothetical protein
VDNRPPFRRLLREPCVCGGPEIVASSASPFDIAAAIVRHQVEPVHIAYDIAAGIPLSIAQMEARALDRELTGVGA